MRHSPIAFVLALVAFAAHADALQMTKEGTVRYFCGGVGADERDAMRALEPQANLKLLFVTVKRGGYLAAAAVSISDGKATRFSAVTDGPICLLELPAGSYRITADVGGVTRSVRVVVSAQAGSPHQVAIEFPGEPWDGIWASDEEKMQGRE